MSNLARWLITLAAVAIAAVAVTYAVVVPPPQAPPRHDEVALTEPSSGDLHVIVEVLATGDARVYERLEGVTARELQVQPPSPVTSLPLVQEPLEPQVADPRFTLDGRPYSPTVDPRGGWRLTPATTPTRHQVEVGYVLRGATVRTTPGPPGRALVIVEPLLVPHAEGMNVRLVVAPPFVRGVSCPLFPLVEAVCANRGPEGWSVERAEADPDELQWVAVQVDLPA